MGKSVSALLKYTGLTTLYSESKYNNQTPLTDAFFGSPINAETDEYDLLVDPTDTTPAVVNRLGGSSRSIDTVNLKQRRGVLFRTFNHQPYGMDVMNAIREPDSRELDDRGRREIERQTAHFRQRHATLKELIFSKILTAGAVYWDRNTGKVEESSGDDNQSITFGIPSANQTDLGGQITTNITSASFNFWGLFSYMDDQSAANNSQPVTDIWINRRNLKYIRENTQFQKWAAANMQDAADILRGNMPVNMFGKTWHFVGGNYTDSGGTLRPYIPTSKLIATPSPGDRSWYEAANGATLVPTSLDMKTGVSEAVNSVQKVYGPFSYAKVKDDPVQVVQYAGDCFGLNLVDPNCIYQATVTGY